MQRRLPLSGRLFFFFLLLSLHHFHLSAQTNQDCLGAVEVCQTMFIDDNPPLGTGTIDNEVDGAAACVDSEINSIWFTFTADQDGDIGFLIIPNNPDDDYDWVLFNLTNASCGDIFSDPSLTVSCNAAGGPGCHGPTGTTVTGIGNDTPGGCMNDGPLNELVPALAGETYVLMVSNWTGTPDGYVLDFGESTIFTSLGTAPTATGFENTCPSTGNGYIEIQGVGSTDYDYTVTDIDGNVVYECFGCSGLVTTDANLPSGDYTITAIENGTTCPLTAFAAITDNFPVAAAEVTNTPCGGIGVDLSASISNEPPGASVSYEWTGPDGTSYFGQAINAPDDGLYTLIATVDGCEIEPVTINVVFQTFVLLVGGNTPVCAGDELTLTAFGNGDSFVWNDLNTGAELGTGNPLTFNPTENTTVQVTATDAASSCTFTADVTLTVFSGPDISVDVDGSLCEGFPVTLTASGLTNDSYQWSDNGAAPNPRTIFGLSAGTYTYSVSGDNEEGCSSTTDVTFTIAAGPSVSLDVDPASVCDGDDVTVTVVGTGINTIEWANGLAPDNQNPVTLTISGSTFVEATVTDANSCETMTSTVIDPVVPPAPTVISCGTASPNSVEFNWTAVPGATSYEITVSGQPPQVVNTTSFTATGLMPGESVTLTVQPQGSGLCPPAPTTITCDALDCQDVNLMITPVDQVCLSPATSSFSLDFTANDLSGTTNWSGNGITDAVNGTFDPQLAGIGDHMISLTYSIGPCTYDASTTIVVRQQPTANFSVSGTENCAGQEISIFYEGNANTSATYTWDFAGGSANPGFGQGPHQISWAAAGVATVSLVVEEEGCVSDAFTQTIFITEPIAAPVINCDAGTSSLTFSWDPVPGAEFYIVDVLTAPGGASFVYDNVNLTYTVSNLSPNGYVEIEVTAFDDGPCPNNSTVQGCTTEDCPMVTVSIADVPLICLDSATQPVDLNATISGGGGGGTSVWSGTGITDTDNGVFDPSVAGIGIWTVTVTYTEGDCVYTATTDVTVNPVPSSQFSIDGTICQTGTATATYTGSAAADADFNWNFGSATADPGTGIGPHTLSWATAGTPIVSLTVTEDGCAGEPVTQTVQVEAPLTPPQLNCESTTTSITFSWPAVPGATDYTVNVIDLPAGADGVFDDGALTYTVTGLEAGESVEIEVVALGDGPCGNSSQTQSCVAEDCPTVMVTIDAVDPICLDAAASSLDLNANITGGAGGGVELWSGTGITDPANGIFDPQVAGVGTWTISLSYSEGVCNYNASRDIVVNAQPTGQFTVDATICQTETATITYTGTATAGADFDWDFGSATADPGTGIGPHTLTWPAAGSQTITLTVTENDCPGEAFSQPVEVEAPLAEPQVSCESTTTTITFSWPPVPGATGYMVNVIDIPAGATGVLDEPTLTYTVTGLNAGETVEIEVVAQGDGPCGNSSQTQSCVAEDCPMVMITIDTVDPICLDATASAVDLNANITGGVGGGVESWSGTGITDAANGIFDPQIAGAGTWTINLAYTEGTCSYTASTDIIVNAQPTGQFTVDATICQTGTATITYTGTATAGADFDWDFGSATANPGTGIGPHTLSWPGAGTQIITLTVTENGCASEPVTQMVEVAAPLAEPQISCETSTSMITFSWPAVTGATGYTVNDIAIPAGATGVFDAGALTYTVTGLNPGETVEIEVIAEGDDPCGDSSQTASCIAEDCPMVMVTIDSVDLICLDATAAPIDLSATITGGVGSGAELWAGPGITDPATGIFDPTVAGVGTWTITLTYTEGDCTYNAFADLTINAQPSGEFAVDGTICQTGTATLTYTGSSATDADFNWDFGGATADPGTGIGPHTLSWPSAGNQTVSLTVTEDGCSSEPFSQVVAVEAPLTEPTISCDVTTSMITFTWLPVPGATGYEVNGITIPAGATEDFDEGNLTFTVTDLDPGASVEIEVVALGDGPCGNNSQTQSCSTEDCPAVTIAIDPVDPVCLDANTTTIDLNATFTGGAGGGTAQWNGPGITDAASGLFDPNLLGPGTASILVSYSEDNCDYTDSIEIVMNSQPSSAFTLDDLLLCVDQFTTITYTGGASAAATYDWEFSGSAAIPGTGQGPHLISWTNNGLTPGVSLIVTENGCAGEPFTLVPTIVDSLQAPIINCTADNTSLTFSWDAVAGATGYMVNVLNEPAGASGVYDENALTYSYTSLQPEDEISIEVVVLTDSPCGPVSTTVTCMTETCAPLAFENVTFGPYCTDAGLQNLSVSIGDNSGVFTWSGAGVNAADATFDPTLSGAGTIPLSVNYLINGCSYDTTFQVVVNPVPTASFTIDSPICVDNTANLVFDGMASAAAEFNWDLDGGTLVSGTDPGPYTVSWPAAGDYTVTLEITDNGCVATPFSFPVQVDAVLEQVEATCQDVSATEITFAWDPVPGADTYDVVVLDGPTGTQNGNTYTLTGLTPDQEVTIEVTASGSSVCGPSVTTATCLAQACQPLDMVVTGSSTICSGDDGLVQLDLTTNQAGPFEVFYTLNGIENQVVIDGDDELILSNLTETTTFEIINITDVTIAECVYDGGQQWEVLVDQPAEAGSPVTAVEFCEGDNQLIDLNNLLDGADSGGLWAESSVPASTGGAFDAANATFSTGNQPAQVYTFTYTVTGGACPDDTAEASVQIQPTPVADAGADQLLDCTMGMTSLGGSGTTAGQTYLWTSNNPDAIIADPAASITEVSSPGTYTLEVTSSAGCSDTDEVVVSADFDVPVANISISDISCFAANDGAIIIDEVVGGVPPFTFSLNGGTPTANTFFNNLGAGEYSLVIQGGNDCFTELFINLQEPEEVVVELVANIQNGENVINLGETVTLEAVYSPTINVDTIIWKPDSLNIDALNSINVMPQETSTYTVTIIDDNGCSDSDDMTIIVQKNREIYVPTAFSPDDDGVNDVLYIGASPEVRSIKSFLVFNRWGESVHEVYDFQPNNPANGWDGTLRGQLLNAAVYVYFAEVEFVDGEVVIFSGDVMLMR
jgi:gliding motility-associated-like protein